MHDNSTQPQQQLTSSELGALWTSYEQNSMSLVVLEYFKQHVTDNDIKSIVESAYNKTQQYLHDLTTIYKKEKMPIPEGFNDNDLNPSASRLFADTFYLYYIFAMAKIGMGKSSILCSLTVRKDIRNFFNQSITNTVKLHDDASEILLDKGLMIRSPFIPKPQHVEFVHNKNYFKGFSMFNKKRNLNSIEIGHAFYNIQTNLLGLMLSTGFSQTAKEKEVKDYMWRSKKIAQKHLKIFADTLIDSDIQSPMSWDTEVLEVTDPIFSDRLMMFHIDFLVAIGVGNYATAAATSMRSDLSLNYTRLSAEVAQFAQDGFEIMIKNGWLEEPPQAANRQDLADQN